MKTVLRRVFSFLFSFLLLIGPVSAVGSVPADVLESTESVVRIETEAAEFYGSGSGFVIYCDKEKTLVATNNHVIEGAYQIEVWVDENRALTARIIASSEEKDLCILKLSQAVDMQALCLEEGTAKQGDAVYAVGFPAAADDLSDQQAHTGAETTITDGIISALRQMTVVEEGTAVSLLQINAAINSGNSGGPLFNERGNVIGINTYGTYNAQGIFGAIDVAELVSFLNEKSIPYVAAKESTTQFYWMFAGITAGCTMAVLVIVLLMRKKRIERNMPSIPLRAYIEENKRKCSPRFAIALLLPVATQLEQLHESGHVHLHVSADSLFIKNGHCILQEPATGDAGRYVNGFAAPEIYRGNDFGVLSDVYSFCSVLFYAATGKVAPNALKLEEMTKEELFAGIPLDFAEIVNTGMAAAPEARYHTMQELIDSLISLEKTDDQREEIWSENTPVPPKTQIVLRREKKNRTVSSKRVAVISCICTGALLLIAVGSYAGCYLAAIQKAQLGEFSAARQLLFVPAVTRLHDSDLCSYVDAGTLLENGNYEAAAVAFAALDYEDSAVLAQQARYFYAAELVKAHNYDAAIAEYTSLADEGYDDAQEQIIETRFAQGMYYLYDLQDYSSAFSVFNQLACDGYEKGFEMCDEVRYCRGCAYVEEGDFVQALYNFKTIKNYKDTSEIIDLLQGTLYEEAVSRYRNKEDRYRLNDRTRYLFSHISDYRQSSDYLQLIDADDAFNTADYFIESDNMMDWLVKRNNQRVLSYVDALIDLFYFEDAAKLLVSYTSSADIFLHGTWKTDDGMYYFSMQEDHRTAYNLPSFDFGEKYRIENGDYLCYKEVNTGDARQLFHFSLLSPDSMEVYCYYNGGTYTLYRQ